MYGKKQVKTKPYVNTDDKLWGYIVKYKIEFQSIMNKYKMNCYCLIKIL